MDESKKRTVLESILKSDKISGAYSRHKANNKLNKKLIIERIMAEIDGLWVRFNDVNKLNRFLESFISNHIRDFLIPKKANDLESVVATNGDKRVEEDPNERLKREIEERKKSKIVIPVSEERDDIGNSGNSGNSGERGEHIEEFINEENIAEKNETSNLESMMNRNNFQQMPVQQMNSNMMSPQQMQMMQQQQMNPNIIPQQQQQNRNFTNKPVQPMQQQPMQQQPMQQQPMQPINNTIAPNPMPVSMPPSVQVAVPIQQQQEPDRSVIHIDSRERNIVECPKSNPFSIYMNDGTTCLVCIRDLVTTNIHNDPYLLVQIS